MTNEAITPKYPEGVASIMYLRDGWPYTIVCKVQMQNGCVGIGVVRYPCMTPDPAEADRAALGNAMAHIWREVPDYTPIQEHVARLKAEAEARAGE